MTLPALRAIIDVISRYRRIALDTMYDVAVEIEDPTLDIPRMGYTEQLSRDGHPVWAPVLSCVPWDWTIHSLRHLADLAEACDGYVHIDVAYVTREESSAMSLIGEPPEPFADGFRVMVWPVFAVEYKSDKWMRLDSLNGPGRTTEELFREAGRFVHSSPATRGEA